MTRSEKNAIADIIRINPFIYELQDIIDEETESIIEDKAMPTSAAIAQLKKIENRRVDLCNLKVLYGIMERELKEQFSVLKACAVRHDDCTLFLRAEKSLKSVGYDAKRVIKEFKYLFVKLGRPKRKLNAVPNNSDYCQTAAFVGSVAV